MAGGREERRCFLQASVSAPALKVCCTYTFLRSQPLHRSSYGTGLGKVILLDRHTGMFIFIGNLIAERIKTQFNPLFLMHALPAFFISKLVL